MSEGVQPEPVPRRIGGRFRVLESLGRGGMAVVYRVLDEHGEREVALKQLQIASDARDAREAAALFEREFHTLTLLSHPRVIEVHDFGVDGGRAYYTMELLDGGDLRERSPAPWQDACRWLFDVCSSLALLHSRRLVHRDISPRNVRCTSSGAAKLIDFGALVPMGAGGHVVGTPAFVAPEVLHRSSVDGRADLYSLGATLYYALTGRPPYAAYDFIELVDAWREKPEPPSHFVPAIPAALDSLTMSLLSLEPAQRPRTAFEVMQRLSAIGGLPDVEALSVSRAYLTTPGLVGREAALGVVREQLERASGGRTRAVLIRAAAGLGRSRMLDAAVLEAKTLGGAVLRASGDAARAEPLSALRALLEQMLAVFGERAVSCARAVPGAFDALFEPDDPPRLRARDVLQGDAQRVIEAACALVLELARTQLVVIAVDDAHEVDEPSCSFLATLADRASHVRMLLALTADAAVLAQRSLAPLRLLTPHCTPIELPALDGAQTAQLLESVFGDVPHLPLVADRIHQVALGKPRETMELAQHLVDKSMVTYQGGSWVLPAQLDATELPNSAAQALAERLSALSPLSRFIVEAQSIAVHPAFSRDDYRLLCAAEPPKRVDEAIDELLAARVLLCDGRLHVLSHGSRSAALAEHLTADALIERHRALARLYEGPFERVPATVHHLHEGGLLERAVEVMVATLATVDDERGGLFRLSDMNAHLLSSLFERMLVATERLGRPARERFELLRYLTTIGVVADEGVYLRAAPRWLAQLELDSGLRDYREDGTTADSTARLQRAYAKASERYASTPAALRVYAPHEAIRLLVHYVVVSIAIGARTRNAQLMASLPAILEPFVALSPLIEAMWQNAIATWEVNCGCMAEQAHARVTALYESLEHVSTTELHNVRSIRKALAYCAGAIEAGMGRLSAMKWADLLDEDSLQLVNAMHIRKIVRLQQGDDEGAERYRRQAELLEARATWRQMFAGTAFAELGAYARAHDLTGVAIALTEIEGLAARCPGWVSARHLGEGHLQRLRGNLEGALESYRRCLELVAPDPAEPWRAIHCWPGAVAGTMYTLLELGRIEDAAQLGEQTLALARARDLSSAVHEVIRALALAEARQGHYARACDRLAELIDQQLKLGISGLWLGASYETRARIAIEAGDGEAVERYSVLTAREYRHGSGSPLGALYERLIADARRAGVRVLPQMSDFESRMMATMASRRNSTQARVAHALRTADNPLERAARALELICEALGAKGGHLCLTDESGLVLAASRGLPAPDPALLELAHEYLSQQIDEEPELATVQLSAAELRATSTTTATAVALASGHRPLLLRCSVDGAQLCAGIALLAHDDAAAEPAAAPAELLAAIGAMLIQAGHTQGMRTRC